MNTLKRYIYQIIIIFLLGLLIFGYSLNKNSSISKKNEISIFAQQLKARNSQISKLQKKMFESGNNINNIINENEINFKKVFDDKKLINFNGYNFSKKKINENIFDGYIFSKYITNDILFNGNLGAVGTAYIDFFNKEKNIFLATYDGIFASAKIENLEKFKKIRSNINSIIKYEKFYFHEQYGIKDIFINNNDLYVSFIGKRKDNCYDLKIISAKLSESFLDFKIFFQTSNCVDVNNDHGFWAHQGAGGRIVRLDDSNLLFTTGDFRNRPLAQNPKSDFGKILKINTLSKKASVVSMGHRNPQGLYYSKKFNFILSTEHGPKGGYEININIEPFLQLKNFGWPISSFGKHYAKHYSEKILKEAPLNKSHKKFGFEEPIKYFDPSIGISQVISLNKDDTEFFIGAMGNEIKDMDLGIHYIKLNKDRTKVTDHNYIPFNERVRDMIINKDKNMIIIFLETTSSLAILNKSKK